MHDAVWEAFRRTCIRVEVPDGFLDIKPAGVDTRGAFPDDAVGPIHVLTAWNPHGRPAPLSTNLAANRHLDEELASRPGLSIRRVTGYGGGPLSDAGTWREEGFGIEGLSLTGALELAIRYDQRAIFAWGDEPGGFRLIAADGSADERRGWTSTFVR